MWAQEFAQRTEGVQSRVRDAFIGENRQRRKQATRSARPGRTHFAGAGNPRREARWSL